MEILVVGIGYVGLVTAASLSEMGHSVICYDIDEQKIEQLNRGLVPFYEPGLEELFLRNKKEKRLFFTTDFQAALKQSQICQICVPTPSLEDGGAHTGHVMQVADEIGKYLDSYKIIVIRSTVPVGTTAQAKSRIAEKLGEKNPAATFDIVFQPEFLREGAAIQDCMKPDRIILGAESPKPILFLKKIYSAFSFSRDRFIIMSFESAELTKYAANAMLATRISFMNEFSLLCEKTGASIHDVRVGIGSDLRIGYHYLYAGAGFGGSCLPKDLRALKQMFQKNGLDPFLIEASLLANQRQKEYLLSKIKNYLLDLEDKTIAILGLAFKPDTDDIREAPSLSIIEGLLKEGANLRLYDPVAISNVRRKFDISRQIIYCDSEYEAFQNADAAVLVTEWKQFRYLDFKKMKSLMRGKALFDGRNQYDAAEMLSMGFDYFGMGTPLKEKKHEIEHAKGS